MKNERIAIMDIPFINLTRKEFLENHLYPRLMDNEKTFVVTANPEIVMRTREDEEYKKIVQSADFVVPDGAGIVLASKYIKQPIKERVAGFDIMLDLLEFDEKKGLSCYFLGAKEEVNKKAVEEAVKKFPNVKIAGRHHGYFDAGDTRIAEQVAKTNPDLVFVALGFPRQEKWIKESVHRFEKGLFMGVGGSFDVLSGVVKRAPEFWIRLNLEWFYRLLKQPFRWKRILKAFEFIIRIVLKK